MNVVYKFCALYTPLKPRILAKVSSENKQALPINIVIVNLVWKYNDLTQIKTDLLYFDLFFPSK